MSGRATNEPTNYFALGKQPAKDTEASTFFFFKHLDGSGWETTFDVTTEREGGDGQEASLRYKTSLKADGAVVVNCRPQAAARLLTYALGVDAFASAVAGATLGDHTITPAATIPYLTAEQRFGDLLERTTNVQITQLTIAAEAARPIKLTGNFLSGGSVYARSAAASALTPTRETTKPIFMPGGSYSLNGLGSYAPQITKWQVDINRNVDDAVYTTGINREDLIPLNQDYNLDLTLRYEDKTLYEQINFGGIGGTAVPVPYLATGSFNAFSSFGSYQFRLNMPLIEFADIKVNKLDPDGKTVYLDVSAMTIKNATYPLFAVVRTDDQAAY